MVTSRFSTDDGDSVISLSQWQALGFDLHSLIADAGALFIDPATGNYLLRPGSPALNAASNQSVANDLRGYPRPCQGGFDIGAYEDCPAVSLTVSPSGTGSGSVIGNGIDCSWNGSSSSGTCSLSLVTNTAVSLSSSPSTGSTFAGWSGGSGSAAGCSGLGACAFQITETSGVVPRFTQGSHAYLPLVIKHYEVERESISPSSGWWELGQPIPGHNVHLGSRIPSLRPRSPRPA